MILVWAGVALLLLKLLEIGPVAELSWWWVLAPFGLGLLWFEFGERIFGMDRRKGDEEVHERRRRERIAELFGKKPGSGSKSGKDR